MQYVKKIEKMAFYSALPFSTISKSFLRYFYFFFNIHKTGIDSSFIKELGVCQLWRQTLFVSLFSVVLCCEEHKHVPDLS